MLNQGGTSFNAAQMTVGGGLYALAAGDFDKNGKLDAIGVHRLAAGTASLTTLINKGGNVSPYFTTAGNQSGGGEAVTAASADFDGDGKLDLAVGNNTASSVAIARGSGLAQNTLADPVAANQYTVGNANARVEHLVAFDVDLDGTPDVVTANYDTAALGVGHPSLYKHEMLLAYLLTADGALHACLGHDDAISLRDLAAASGLSGATCWMPGAAPSAARKAPAPDQTMCARRTGSGRCCCGSTSWPRRSGPWPRS